MIPTFYRGDTIRVELSLRDDSGVAHVVGVFAHTKPGRFSQRDPASSYEHIWLHGEGRGKSKAEVAITRKVDERTATGEYVCLYVQAHDTQGNYRIFRPDPEIRFRIDNDPYDHDGPELGGVALSGCRLTRPPVVAPDLWPFWPSLTGRHTQDVPRPRGQSTPEKL